jgi:hypothetical protein
LGELGGDGRINIKINLSEIGNDDVDWIYMAQDRDYGEFLWKRKRMKRQNSFTDGTSAKFSITLLYGGGY